MAQQSITVGTIIAALDSTNRVYVDGQIVYAPSIAGGQAQTGQSVTVLRLGDGRYQMLGHAAYWAPQQALPS